MTSGPASSHMVYLASAGTGKTHQLTNRYIELVARGVEPHAILATTFTRKAAGEILGRVLQRLAEGATTEKGLLALRASIPSVAWTAERCAALTAKLARGLHRVNIGTIDSFFARVLRSFALDLSAPPQWTIIDDEPDRDLRSAAVTAALDAPDREAEVERVRVLLRMLYGGGHGRGVHSRILRCVADWYAAALSSLSHPELWERFAPDGPAPSAADAQRLAESLASVPVPLNKSDQPNGNWVKNLSKLQELVRNEDWEGVAEHGLIAAVAAGTDTYYKLPFPAGTRGVLEPVLGAARAALLSQLLERNRSARELLSGFDAAYTALKMRRGMLRFDDVPRMILEAGAQDRLEEMYYRLDARIQHLLLDEFQDTSLDQFAVLKPMLEELAAVADGSRSVLCVGDVKQSLYSWRGGEPRLLPAIPERWPQFDRAPLTHNRRSSPAIIEAVNTVFGSIATNPVMAESTGAAGEWSGMFEAHEAYEKDLPGLVQVVAGPEAATGGNDGDADDEETDKATQRATFIAAHAAAIARESPRASIAILTRTNRLIPRLILELREAHGLSAIGERGNPLTDTPAAAAAISALHLADHPEDSAALFHLAVTPCAALLGLRWELDRDLMTMRARQVASRLRRRVARDGVADFLRWLQRRLEPAMDEFGHARFDQLIDLAEATPGVAPGEFARLAREREVEPPARLGAGGDAIRIMTVHKAKGLEFDAVILAELDTAWTLRGDSLVTDRRDEQGNPDPLSGIAAVTTWPSKPYQIVAPELGALYERFEQRKHVEELCLLYVAMTRAKRRLDLIAYPPFKDGKPTGQRILLSALAGGALPGPGEFRVVGRTAKAWHEGLEEPAVAGAQETLEVRLAPAGAIPAGRLARTSPSSLEGGDHIELADLWGPAGTREVPDARDRGSAFHAMFECVEWLDGPGAEPAAADLDAALAEIGAPEGMRAAWKEEFLRCLRGEAGAALRRERYRGRAGELRLRREWEFAVREPVRAGESAEHILNGAIDRLVIGEVGGGAAWAEVMDFKTDEAGDDESLARSVERYRPQIEAYRRAAAAVLGLSPTAVSACLVFTGPGRIVAL